MFATKADLAMTASPARWRKPSGTGCSTSPKRPRASAATSSRLNLTISRRWSV